MAARALPWFADGVWLVELARLGNPESVAGELAEVLGVRDEIPGRLLDGLRVRLREASALIVMDN